MIATCPHGFPTPASCVDCMYDDAVMPPRLAPEQKVPAERWYAARFDGVCGRNRTHIIEAGEQIGLTVDFGWCCERCAS